MLPLLMLISYPPEKLIRVGVRLLPRLRYDFNSVTSLIQVFIQVFYIVLVCTNTFLKMDYLVICKVVLELWNWVGITKTGLGYRESISSSSNIYIYLYIKYYSFVSEYYMIPKFQNSSIYAWSGTVMFLLK